jgi:alpha-glucosidase
MTAADWWHGTIIYQIYPRSFLDTNGDGIGDLPGISRGLDYVASLGVEAIWVSPFYRSPMADFGYDIADFRAVDPMFGTLEDFDRLLHKAHQLGLKVIIDQVLSHTSAQHPWFQQSRQSRDNPRADWYVWADARADGGPPNNWLSIFGGTAWQWEPRRSGYYLHNFLASQPDLNYHNPQVREAMLENVRFWLDRGVDGVRLDAINFCFHDQQLRDNPAKPPEMRAGRGYSADNPYAYQYHRYDNTRPENLDFLRELRALLDRYPGTVALGEVSSEDSAATMAEYTAPGRLHMAYSFELLGPDRSPAHIRATVENLQSRMTAGWPCWSISNHDVERVVSRWGSSGSPRHLATQLTALVCSLRGSVCIFQGEELGLGQADVPFHLLQDPFGIAFWPNFKGRDGCRTPMPWSSSAHAGFSDADPWLPVPPEHLPLAVAAQERDADSTLHAFRRFMRWRRAMPVLRHGDIEFIASTDSVLVFTRRMQAEGILAAFNLSPQPQSLELAGVHAGAALSGHGLPEGTLDGNRLWLPVHGALFTRLA